MPNNNGLLKGRRIAEILESNAQEPISEPARATSGDDFPILANWTWGEESDRPKKRGLALPDLCHELDELTDGWPRRVDKTLFVPGAGDRPRFLEKPAELFAWLDSKALIDWGRQSDMISQERLFAHLRESATKYDAVEQFPHWPPLANTYYMHPKLPNSNGQHLNALVDFFSPLTSVDRRLIRAFIVCLAWGGPPGSRPAWLFTAKDDDNQGGRGAGKSKLIELCSELVGGMLEISPTEDIIGIKKRLLSPESRTLRIARIDNIKTYRFSWADLEALITSPIISGHRMYQGEGRRPNSLTWTLTLNGASLSKDMAKRVIVVKVKRPTYGPSWEQEVRAHIETYRWHILNDIRLFLDE